MERAVINNWNPGCGQEQGCNWFRGSKGPYFTMGGMPAKAAQLFADYYKTH